MDAAREERTRAALPRIVVRCALLGVAVDLAIFIAIAVSDAPKYAALSVGEVLTLALLGFTVGLVAAPVSAVEILGAGRPRSARRDAIIAAAAFVAAAVGGILTLFEGFYLEALLQSRSPSAAFARTSSTFGELEPVHFARIFLMAGAFALPFPVVVIGRLRSASLLRQLLEIVAAGGVAAVVVAIGAGAEDRTALLLVVLLPAVGVGATLPFLYRGADLIEDRAVRWWLGSDPPSGETPAKTSV